MCHSFANSFWGHLGHSFLIPEVKLKQYTCFSHITIQWRTQNFIFGGLDRRRATSWYFVSLRLSGVCYNSVPFPGPPDPPPPCMRHCNHFFANILFWHLFLFNDSDNATVIALHTGGGGIISAQTFWAELMCHDSVSTCMCCLILDTNLRYVYHDLYRYKSERVWAL